ncbi:hypothetical protein DICPUDRAFT_77715 [Dictyostelium purpureum]|uniref:Myb domain-containing protein n=1 Tax=Dictyostelium purpureum TaxID=5786 RepID=F0ZHE9_DICPU|nr:uncharacterized protein DICPUDRAFT_77715 [Dictyostelium purpureum]EGC36602.1 hypothetical protein DICPUDRAFT_77715 [Dictyostelium purpureum]|eukprot:XP_003286840.1 hypothetical protein DICPUDRAFT_77715 [Dictyostelium purpureum]
MRGIKGGVWKNTEDEILKVAIMKYGLNQWARISSLLTRKSPAQCKARWYEWLDPNIKKTEWSKEEEEKLLHLAKIFPSQWKTIAPLVGRTSAQCLERYNKLLDEVQRQQDGESGTGEENDPRRLRMGDIDPTPETKPAKPDPIDMDEDEKETLSEAKARLSNTQGKKEKRKFREKQLEEARRLAFLQKKRELKAAGINYNPKKKGKETSWDLNKEIPFYLKPKAGFYDVPDEELRDDPNKDQEFIGKRIDQIENPKYLERQEKANKLDDIKKKKKELFDLPKAIADVSKLNDVEHTVKRSKMVLPEPQLTDDDIQEIADYEKINGGEGLSSDGFPVPAPRTPANTIARTPVREDTIMMEAKNLLDLSNAQTPLKVDVSATPKPKQTTTTTTTSSTPLRTPNPLLAQTPNRKNVDSETSFSNEDKFKKQQNKNQLLSSLKSLPSPSIEYKLELPSEAPTIEEDQEIELDSSETHIREEQQLKHKEQFKLRNRSTVLKRNLPRSRNLFKIIDEKHSSKSTDQNIVQIDSTKPLDSQIVKIIQKEINKIISHDNIIFPNDSQTPSLDNEDKDYEYFSQNELINADKLIKDEVEQIKLEQNDQLSVEQILERIDEFKSNYTFVIKENQFVEKSLITNDQNIQNLKFDFDKTYNKIKILSSKSVNLEKKLNIYNGGYQKRSNDIIKDIGQLYDQLEHSEIELQCYTALKNNETVQMEKRLKTIENDVYDQCEIEARLQNKYSNLLNERNSLKRSLK